MNPVTVYVVLVALGGVNAMDAQALPDLDI
jgi:hypothetical protein